MLQFNRGAVLKGILTLLVTPPSIPNRHRTVCCRMLEDFREFGSAGWTNLPEAEVSNTVCNGRRDIHISRWSSPWARWTTGSIMVTVCCTERWDSLVARMLSAFKMIYSKMNAYVFQLFKFPFVLLTFEQHCHWSMVAFYCLVTNNNSYAIFSVQWIIDIGCFQIILKGNNPKGG